MLEHPTDLQLLRILMGLTKCPRAGRLARCLYVPVILAYMHGLVIALQLIMLRAGSPRGPYILFRSALQIGLQG